MPHSGMKAPGGAKITLQQNGAGSAAQPPSPLISRKSNHALPDAVEAAAFKAHRTQMVEDERKYPRHYPQRHLNF